MTDKKRRILFSALTIVVLIAIAVLMFIIGRGHTLYFDNKAIEYNGQICEPFYKITIKSGGEQQAKLYEKERGMATCIGQTYRMTIEVVSEKNGTEETKEYTLKLPYSMDGIVINLPAYLAGLPEEAYLSEFVSMATEADTEEAVVTDEFGF